MKTFLIIGFVVFAIVIFVSCNTKTKKSNLEHSEVLFSDSLGNTLSKKDLLNVTGKVNYEIIGIQNIDSKARMLHQEARKLGQVGKYDMSIVKLREAIKIQPDWAYLTYDLAYTYLLKGDFDNALLFYKKTDELEPNGFFTAKTAIYSLEGEKIGKFPKGLYISYLQIEWSDNLTEKIEIAKTITEQIPDFAPAWKELANLLDDETEKLNAIEQGLLRKPDAETKGILTINKAIILNNRGNKGEAKNLLGNLIFSPDVTLGNLELAKFVLKTINEQ